MVSVLHLFFFFDSTTTAATVFFIHSSFAAWVYRCKWYFVYNNQDDFVLLPVKENECVNNFSNKKVAKRIRKYSEQPCVYGRIAIKTTMAKGYHIILLLFCSHIHTHTHLFAGTNSFSFHSFAFDDVKFVRLNATQRENVGIRVLRVFVAGDRKNITRLHIGNSFNYFMCTVFIVMSSWDFSRFFFFFVF